MNKPEKGALLDSLENSKQAKLQMSNLFKAKRIFAAFI